MWKSHSRVQELILADYSSWKQKAASAMTAPLQQTAHEPSKASGNPVLHHLSRKRSRGQANVRSRASSICYSSRESGAAQPAKKLA